MKVYQAINAVQSDLAVMGITKDRRSEQGSKFLYRGIDDVYNAVSPLLAKHHLVIIPRMLNRVVTERRSNAGGALFSVVVEAEFDVVSSEDGSKHTARTFGEAMDSGDKATNKAMSAAYKYLAFQMFAIPTEGDNDADASTHHVVPVLSQHQIGEIRSLLAAKDADEAMLLTWLSAKVNRQFKALAEVPADAYEAIVRSLKKTKEST